MSKTKVMVPEMALPFFMHIPNRNLQLLWSSQDEDL